MPRVEERTEAQQLTVRLPRDVHRAVRTLAYATEQSVNDIVLRALRSYLSDEGHRETVEAVLKRARTEYRVALDKLADL